MLDISQQTPAAALNNDLADAVKAQHGLTMRSVPRTRSGYETGPEWLISCGTLMSSPKGELLVFERTLTNPANGKPIAWPGAMNNPMGRADGLPSAVCLKEGAEELGIYRDLPPASAFNLMPRVQPVQFTVAGKTGISRDTERELTAKLMTHLAKTNDVPPGELQSEIGTIPAVADKRYDGKTINIETRLGGKVVDSFRGIAVMSPGERTIEIAQPLRLQSEQPLSFFAREPMGRKMMTASQSQLEAAHYAWALRLKGTLEDAEQKKHVAIGGILPILQGAVLGMKEGAILPSEVTVPLKWTPARIRSTLGL